jgi:hypothetical protein
LPKIAAPKKTFTIMMMQVVELRDLKVNVSIDNQIQRGSPTFYDFRRNSPIK